MVLFKKACVVGAGTMGHGIAYILAEAGIETCLIDQQGRALENALTNIDRIIESGLNKEKLSLEQADEIASLISTSQDLDALADTDLMIEAVSEDIEVKHQIFSLAQTLADEDALLASNTSSLSIGAIANVVENKERVLGLHFFNPPHIMKLLEIVVHPETSPYVVEQARALSECLRKECIVVCDSPGFATSRLGISFALEAIRMLEQGVAGVLELDTAMKLGYGHPMGPLMLTDWVGLDVRLSISEHLYKTLDSHVFEPPDLLRRMVRAGFYGRKSGTGFYEWDANRSLGVSQSLMDLFQGI